MKLKQQTDIDCGILALNDTVLSFTAREAQVMQRAAELMQQARDLIEPFDCDDLDLELAGAVSRIEQLLQDAGDKRQLILHSSVDRLPL